MDANQLPDEAKNILAACALAMLGGAVRALRLQRCNYRTFLVEILTSLFAGLLAWLLLGEATWPAYVKFAATGVAGHVAPRFLDLLARRFAAAVSSPQEGGKP